jgi:leader peptidase (prepilin peptidase)/N-methyltransferase
LNFIDILKLLHKPKAMIMSNKGVYMAEISLQLVMGTMLLACGIQDALKKKINLWIIISGGLLIGICVPFCGTFSFVNLIGGVLIGACVIGISIVTGGKIGIGDGLLLCVTGIGLGFWGNLELFGFALFLAAGLSIVLLIFRLADRKKSIPFVPFLFFGYVLLVITDFTGMG